MLVDTQVSSMTTSHSGSRSELAVELFLATIQDIGAVLLDGMRRLFCA